MFVCKSIGNIQVVVQPETVQGFVKKRYTLDLTGDNRGTRGFGEGAGGGMKKRREHNKRDKEKGG